MAYEEIRVMEPIKKKNIADSIDLSHLNNEEKDGILKILDTFADVFYKEGDKLTATDIVVHEINTKTDKALYSKIYRYPQVHEQEIERQINEMLEQNIITNSNSPYNSPLWIVPKKVDNSGKKKWRLVVDYRLLNNNTIDDKFPIPNLNSILDKLGRSQYFTTLDLAKGFYQIKVNAKDRAKTAFSTPFGHYEFVRMPFGLKNAPSTFQRLINTVLRQHINKICVVYMDDILIFGTSLEEHICNINSVLSTLRQANLKVQPDKCDFLKKETSFLGHILTANGVKPDSRKIDTIQTLKLPVTQKQIKSFLGMTGFYRKFIKDYAKIASPMIKYLQKDARVNKNDPNYIFAFEKLKDIVTKAPILRYPNFSKKFKLTTDASNFALGAVLTQDGHPVAYASRTLNKHECNYSTVEKELLAIVWAVKYFRPYVYGREFDLQTDHQPLKWLQAKFSGKDINPRLQRWILQLGEYNAKIEHIKGKDNKIADFLSRINSDHFEINCLNDTKRHNRERRQSESSMEVETTHSQEEEHNDHIPILTTIVNRFHQQIIFQNTKHKEFEQVFNNKRLFIDKTDLLHDRILTLISKYFLKGKIAIYSEINDHEYNKLQQTIIEKFGGGPMKFVKCSYFAEDIHNEDQLHKQIALFHKNETGHAGIIPTFEGIKTKIYNPKLKENIHKIINNCDICTGGKYDRKPIKKEFSLTETPKCKNQIVHVDTYVNSKQAFIIFVDKFTKHAICFPLMDRNSRTLVSKIQEFISIKGKIKKFIFDNEFNNTNVKEFLNKECIEFHFTKPNSHTGNADAERLNNTITEKIRTLNIEEKLPIIEQINKAIFHYNNLYHSTIKCTPFDAENNKVNQNIIYRNLVAYKDKKINRVNKDREKYLETRQQGFIKNYKSVRHKEQPKFVKKNLEGIHISNIKRPLKFAGLPDNIPIGSHSPNRVNSNNPATNE